MRNINLKYFLYARKSSESEDRQMASIEDQIAEVKKLALKLNITIVDIISESKSAKEPGRIGFNSMLNRISKGEAQGILTWKLNRLARNPIDGGQISWMLQKDIIKHIQTFERDYNPSDNVLLMQVEFGMANQYVKDLSLDIQRGMRQKAERGWYPIAVLPIGYTHNPRFIPNVDEEIIPDKETFQILRKLWQMYLSGKYSIADIKRKGDAMGFKTKSNQFCPKTTYYYIFRNEFYCGYFNWKDKDGNVIRYKGKHKPLVSLYEFQKTQLLIEGKHGTVIGRKYNYPYRGIMTCGECGYGITPDHKLQAICTNCKRKFSIKSKTACPQCGTELSEMEKPSIIDILYYHCTKPKGNCSQGAIKKEEIDNAIEKELSKISISENFYSWSIESLKMDLSGINTEDEIKKLRRRKTELENRISGLINIRADGEINSEQFNDSTSKIQKEIASIELEIEETEGQVFRLLSEMKDSHNFSLNVLDRFKKGDDLVKNEIARGLVSNLKLSEKKLDFTIRKPLLKIKESLSLYQSKKVVSNLKTPL